MSIDKFGEGYSKKRKQLSNNDVNYDLKLFNFRKNVEQEILSSINRKNQTYKTDIINELSAKFKEDLKREIAKEVNIINSTLSTKERDDLTHIDEEINRKFDLEYDKKLKTTKN